MTRPNFKLPKEPIFANDNFQEHPTFANGNFQELPTEFQSEATAKVLQVPRDSLHVTDGRGAQPELSTSYMVPGSDGQEDQNGVEAPPLDRDRFADWMRKTKIGRRKITRALGMPAVRDLTSAWHHARIIGQPVNRFITFKPHDLDAQDCGAAIRMEVQRQSG